MGRMIYIFCEECGARLEVEENDPRVFCEECGAEVENVRYRPEDDDAEVATIFAANTEDSDVDYEEEGEFETYDETFEEEYYSDSDENVDFDSGFDHYRHNHSHQNMGLDQATIDTIQDAMKMVPDMVAQALNDKFTTKTVVNNSATTTINTTKTFSTRTYHNDNNEDDVKEIFVDHEYAEKVTEGVPVTYYAVIERRGRFFTGECPEVPFTSVDKAYTFEECLEEIKDELEERVNGFGGKVFHQPRLDIIQAKYPMADIVEITIYKKK